MRAADLLKKLIQAEQGLANQALVSRTNFLNSKIIKTLAPLRNALIPNQNISYLIKTYNQYHTSHQEKNIALDHLLYIMNNNPVIPYNLFPKKDHPLITQYLKNQFLLVLHSSINPKKLFTPKLQVQPNYGLNLIKKTKINNTTVIDCGAFTGDTVLLFNQLLNPKKIVALEPDPLNLKRLTQTIKKSNLTNVLAIPTAVGSSKKTAGITLSGTAGAHLSPRKPNQPTVPTNTIDNLVKKHTLQNIKLIKMDIEGSELEALKGAKKTIKKHQPALIISAYHQGRDIFEIPPLINKLNSHYKLRFANIDQSSPTTDKVIIAQ